MIAALLMMTAMPSPAAEPLARTYVSSQEWVIVRSPEKAEEFVGDVRYWKGPTSVRADWARYAHEERRWEARGKIRAVRHFESGDRLETSGERASHGLDDEKGWLRGPEGSPVPFSRTTADGAVEHGSAGRVEWQGASRVRLTGGVRYDGVDSELRADQAEADLPGRSILLTGGRPTLRYGAPAWLGALKADAVAAREPRAINADGAVEGWLIFRGRKR